jgi:transposase
MVDHAAIRDRYVALSPHLDERGRRSFAAGEARAAGYGGIAAVSRATGVAASTIGRGLKELACGSGLPLNRVRLHGGGRKPLVATNVTLLDDLLALVSPSERGDPMSPLRWTCKGLRRLATELGSRGHKISHTVVGELLKQQKFSLQANRKDPRARQPSRSRRAVCPHQCKRDARAGRAAAGDFGRHEEEGTGGGLQEGNCLYGALHCQARFFTTAFLQTFKRSNVDVDRRNVNEPR